MDNVENASKTWFLLAACCILFMAFLAGFAYGYVHAIIYKVGNPELTLQLLQKNLGLFQLEIVSWIGILFLDVFVAIGIYKIYRESNEKIAVVTSALRIFYAVFLGVAIVFLAKPLITDIDSENSLVPFESFAYIWNAGLIVFGLHLIALSIVAYKSGYTPKMVGVLLGIGGLSYLLVHSMKLFLPGYGESIVKVESFLALPMAVSEL